MEDLGDANVHEQDFKQRSRVVTGKDRAPPQLIAPPRIASMQFTGAQPWPSPAPTAGVSSSSSAGPLTARSEPRPDLLLVPPANLPPTLRQVAAAVPPPSQANPPSGVSERDRAIPVTDAGTTEDHIGSKSDALNVGHLSDMIFSRASTIVTVISVSDSRSPNRSSVLTQPPDSSRDSLSVVATTEDDAGLGRSITTSRRFSIRRQSEFGETSSASIATGDKPDGRTEPDVEADWEGYDNYVRAVIERLSRATPDGDFEHFDVATTADEDTAGEDSRDGRSAPRVNDLAHLAQGLTDANRHSDASIALGTVPTVYSQGNSSARNASINSSNSSSATARPSALPATAAVASAAVVVIEAERGHRATVVTVGTAPT
ncbi:hypothetical protein HK405_014165, partial [Cladochytrium tenue]